MSPPGIVLEGGESLEQAERDSLRSALAAVIDRCGAGRHASVYRLARGCAIVRVFLGQGWVPVMLERRQLHDGPALARRLAVVLDGAPGRARGPSAATRSSTPRPAGKTCASRREEPRF